jgi:phytol kinase
MAGSFLNPFFLALCFLVLFGFAEFLYHQKKVKAEITRKIVHIGTGLLTLLFPVFLNSHWQVLFLCSSFLIILLASLHFRLLPSINGISRVSHGSILFPIAVYACFLLYLYAQKGFVFFYLPVLILSICDPVAALTGKRFPFGKYRINGGNKTIAGSLAFFVTSALVAGLCLYFHQSGHFNIAYMLPSIFLIACTTTAVEAVSTRGTDNITIPAVAALNLALIL